MVFKESLKGVSLVIEGCFKGVFSWVSGCLNEVWWVFEKSFKGVLRMCQGSFMVVSMKIKGSS